MSSNNRDYISCRNPAATKQQEAGSRLEQDGAKFGAPQSKRKSQEGGKNQWQKRIKASVCFLKWDVERR